MEMFCVDKFVQIVDLLPPAFMHRRNFHCVRVAFDQCWLNNQIEDLGRTHFEVTFRVIDKEWSFEIAGKLWPVDLLVDTIRRLPKVSKVETDFVNMHISERLAAVSYGEEGSEATKPLRNVMFHKTLFDNPNGSRPILDWAIRVGKREFDD